MNKELLDKYSKISIIVIAVILVISFIGVVYSKVQVPYQESLLQEREYQEYFEASQKRQENQALLNKCYAEVEAASRQRALDSCTHKIGTGRMTCFVSSEEYPQFDYSDNSCGEYFYCSSDFSNTHAELAGQKDCKEKYH